MKKKPKGDILADIINQVEVGELDPSVAVKLGRGLFKESGFERRKKSGLERRVKKLEKIVSRSTHTLKVQ